MHPYRFWHCPLQRKCVPGRWLWQAVSTSRPTFTIGPACTLAQMLGTQVGVSLTVILGRKAFRGRLPEAKSVPTCSTEASYSGPKSTATGQASKAQLFAVLQPTVAGDGTHTYRVGIRQHCLLCDRRCWLCAFQQQCT